MAALFTFLGLVFIVIIVLNNRVVKRGFDVAEKTCDEAFTFIDKAVPPARKMAEVGINAAYDAAIKSYEDSLEARFQKGDFAQNLKMRDQHRLIVEHMLDL